jgi:two-component system chemotaxis sensor kinase CheA
MVPVATVTDQLNRTVRDLARSLGKVVHWEVRGGDTELDRGVLHQLSDSLIHLVRNAVDHGIESPDDREAAGKPRQATIRLHAMQLGSEVIIAVTDDGKGIDVDRVRSQAARQGFESADLSDDDALQLVFRSGLSTSRFVTDISGRGVGLDVVRTSVEAVRGRVEVRSQHGGGTEFRVVVPVTLAVLPCLLVVVGGQRFALALHSVVLAQTDDAATQAHAEGRSVIWIDGQPVPVSGLAETMSMAPTEPQNGPVVVLSGTSHRHAFQVDRLIGQRDVVVKGISRLLSRLEVIAGASVEPDGSILLVLDAPGLVDRARRTKGTAAGTGHRAEQSPVRDASLLVVDDALTVRELQRTILERAGYRVRVASDGIEALAMLAQEASDLVLTDVEMPTMDGFGLTEAIRAHATLSNVPVLILTSRSSDADRLRGLEAGADGYIVKSAFDERGLLTAIERLLGSRA